MHCTPAKKKKYSLNHVLGIIGENIFCFCHIANDRYIFFNLNGN